MENETYPAVVVIETVEITSARTDRPDVQHRPAGRTSGMRANAIGDYFVAHPALVTISGALMGYVLVRLFAKQTADATRPPMTRRLAVLRRRPVRDACGSGDSLKRHGDKYASAFADSGRPTSAPTYPEG